MGLESGDDAVLTRMNKADHSEDMIRASGIVNEAGIKLSVTVISGLGGKDGWEQHAIKTGEVLTKMNPQYIGVLTLMLSSNTPISKWIDNGQFIQLSPEEILLETRVMLEHLSVTDCAFRSNHASNYVNLSAQLPFEKNEVISQIDHALKHRGFKPEGHRQL